MGNNKSEFVDVCSMKKKIIICFIVAILLVVSFFAGSCVKEQKQNKTRIYCCRTLISFAIDKADNRNIDEPSVRAELASNIYAAYLYCDDITTAVQIHDLWNYVLNEGDNSAAKEIVVQELNAIFNSYHPPKK